MKNTYTAPQITVMDLEMESQILTGSQVTVEFVNEGEDGYTDYSGPFHSSENIFVWDDEEEEQ